MSISLKDKNVVFWLEGAATFADMPKVSGGQYKVPDVDTSYTYGLLRDGMLFASKDGKNFKLAIVGIVGGKKVTANDLMDAKVVGLEDDTL